jgi:hypothetical protein
MTLIKRIIYLSLFLVCLALSIPIKICLLHLQIISVFQDSLSSKTLLTLSFSLNSLLHSSYCYDSIPHSLILLFYPPFIFPFSLSILSSNSTVSLVCLPHFTSTFQVLSSLESRISLQKSTSSMLFSCLESIMLWALTSLCLLDFTGYLLTSHSFFTLHSSS